MFHPTCWHADFADAAAFVVVVVIVVNYIQRSTTSSMSSQHACQVFLEKKFKTRIKVLLFFTNYSEWPTPADCPHGLFICLSMVWYMLRYHLWVDSYGWQALKLSQQEFKTVSASVLDAHLIYKSTCCCCFNSIFSFCCNWKIFNSSPNKQKRARVCTTARYIVWNVAPAKRCLRVV